MSTDASLAVQQHRTQLLNRARMSIAVFMAGLVLSGATAIPLTWELHTLLQLANRAASPATLPNSATYRWIETVYRALIETDTKYPFLPYGFDWLAFGHFCIAIAFIGALRDPVRNIWVLQFGMICCALVIPYALIFGAFRGIPFVWRLIDCSFGIFGFPVLWYAYRCTTQLPGSYNTKAKAKHKGTDF